MQEILSGKLTFTQARQSEFFQQMEPRLKPLIHLEEFLDSNEIIFRYNAKVHTFSVIQADYLLQNDFEGQPVYLFLAKRTGDDTQVCRTFFPKAEKDYAQSQPRYTLLKKEKINIVTGEVTVQYDRLTPKTTKKRKAEREANPSQPSFYRVCESCCFCSCSWTSSPKILSTFCFAVW